MTRVADRIMKRVSAHGRGRWVCTPKDFLDLGGRQAVDQALSRLVKAGRLRRAGRGLYDLPRTSDVLKRPAPVDLDASELRLPDTKTGGRAVPLAPSAVKLLAALPRDPDSPWAIAAANRAPISPICNIPGGASGRARASTACASMISVTASPPAPWRSARACR